MPLTASEGTFASAPVTALCVSGGETHMLKATELE